MKILLTTNDLRTVSAALAALIADADDSRAKHDLMLVQKRALRHLRGTLMDAFHHAWDAAMRRDPDGIGLSPNTLVTWEWPASALNPEVYASGMVLDALNVYTRCDCGRKDGTCISVRWTDMWNHTIDVPDEPAYILPSRASGWDQYGEDA
ncbi:MAG: hypothetical protein VW498_01480 [Candidatus Thalassarchaeaceae archaeon]